MIKLKDWLDVVEHRVTEGDAYTWYCFGYNAHCLTSWDGDHEGSSFNIIFDTQTQEVYCVEAHDFARDRAYRLINPAYVRAHNLECKSRGIVDCAWEQDDGTPVNYIDLEVDEDWLEKARAIFAGDDYDTHVSVPVDFSDEELLKYMKMAHERDMTFNAFVEEALREAIAKHIPTLRETA
jgi:hypothetical protein